MRTCCGPVLPSLLFGFLLSCNGSEPQAPPDPPSGSAPRIEFTVTSGNVPFEGEIIITPLGDSRNWRYSVGFDDPQGPTKQGVGSFAEGIVENEVRLSYRYTVPGLRSLSVHLFGPGDAFAYETRTILANDPNGARIAASRDISELDGYFEGIAVDRRGEFLYAMNYTWGELFQLSSVDLDERNRVTLNMYYPEGLSITPSDSLLFTVHKGRGLSVISIPSLELRRHLYQPGSFFVHALDDTLALTSGGTPFALIDTRIENGILRQFPYGNANVPGWHFAVSPDGRTAAVLDPSEPAIAFLIQIPSFTIEEAMELPIQRAYAIAFDPLSVGIFVLGIDGMEVRLLWVDLRTRALLADEALGPAYCQFCVANPAATSSDGRYIVFALDYAAYFVDTSTKRLAHKVIGVGSGVAADPRSNSFYFIRPDGVLTKVELP